MPVRVNVQIVARLCALCERATNEGKCGQNNSKALHLDGLGLKNSLCKGIAILNIENSDLVTVYVEM